MADGARYSTTRRRARREPLRILRIAQDDVPYLRFWLEHLVPRQHRGGDDFQNLALSCPWCNRRKGPNLTAIDPESGDVVLLFNPRTQVWDEQFRLEGAVVVGLTPTGRATVDLLRMNDSRRRKIRVLASSRESTLE